MNLREGTPRHGEVQERALLEYFQKLGKVATDFLMHSAYQAHLVQGASAVRATAVCPPNHFLKLEHGGSLDVRMPTQHAALDHQVGMVLGKVVDKIGHTMRCTVNNAHDIASHAWWIFIESFLEKILCQPHHVSWLEVADLVPIQVQHFPASVGVHFSAHKASQAHVSKLQRSRHSRDKRQCTDDHRWRAQRGRRRRSRVGIAMALLFALNAHISLRSTLAFTPTAHATAAAVLDR